MEDKMKKRLNLCIWLALFLILYGNASTCSANTESQTIYYAMERNGVVYGYMETIVTPVEEKGKQLIRLEESIKSMSSLMGAPVNTTIKSESFLDPEQKKLISQEFLMDQGSVKLEISILIKGNKAYITQNMGGGTKEVLLPEDAVLSEFYLHSLVWEDFTNSEIHQKQYHILDSFDREIQVNTFTKIKEEKITLDGNIYDSTMFDVLNQEIGAKQRVWIDATDGTLLQQKIINSTFSLSDKSIKNKLKRVRIDDHIFADAGVMISDIMAISSMKVKATLNPIGNWTTKESLNIPGQKFEGTVDKNHVQGVFEISHKKFDGQNPPPFPPDFHSDPELKPFLNPEDFIESDDPVLIKKARELTSGAADSWEAIKRLSQWVAEEIGYDIPGGGSARNTFDLRAGECGAHSRLFTALCRAVGIPSRVVWGCIYVPNRGGSFGQHGWNEVYMGEAGWIPLDTTLREIDFVDSSHIRLGILTSKHIAFNPDKMEILDFHAGSQRFGQAASTTVPEQYKPYVGGYRGPENVLKVLVQNNSLALDIPGRMIFELKDPDENGLWYFKLTTDAAVSFEKNSSGEVTSMNILSKARIPKKSDSEETTDNIPEQFRPYIGQYPVPMQEGVFTVFYSQNNLAVKHPAGRILYLEEPDEQGQWACRNREEKISFVKDDEGRVRFMIIHEPVHAPKID